MAIETGSMDAMLAELKAVSGLAQGKSNAVSDADGSDFSSILKNTLDQVNNAQQTAQQMTQDFAAGQEGVNLQDVMINLQKASLSFQEMVQVRNKLVSAYQEIMNIQV